MRPAPTIVALIGGGKLARAAVMLLKRANVDVVVAARDPVQQRELKALGARVAPARDAVAEAALVFLAIPAPAFPEVIDDVAGVARGSQIVLHAARGAGPGFELPHQMIRARSCWKKIAVLGGPLYVDDAAAGRPLSAALASRYDEAVRAVRLMTTGTIVRISATRDVTGVEVAGALSNVGHLAAGLARGSGFGETDQGLLSVRALLEASRLGVFLGAERATFTGLAGVGDLIPRNLTSTRLHRDFGEQLAGGGVISGLEQLEGVVTARAGAVLAEKSGLDLPLLRGVDDVLAGRASAKAVLDHVLSLDLGLQAA
ncbi:MAG: NAD(P)-binding domain-containing protein [Deltaproteobacteria bacterium]|nr:NAD(P)-binding domain-containing protein [Deltaproteobacteria bacterium]